MDWSFGDVFWGMAIFFFWCMVIWMFIAMFADIFSRDDLSGWAKAGWVLLIVVLPLLGILIYLIARPKMTEQDRRSLEEVQGRERRMTGYSTAEEIEKLAKLKEAGQISEQEFQTLKQQAMS